MFSGTRSPIEGQEANNPENVMARLEQEFSKKKEELEKFEKPKAERLQLLLESIPATYARKNYLESHINDLGALYSVAAKNTARGAVDYWNNIRTDLANQVARIRSWESEIQTINNELSSRSSQPYIDLSTAESNIRKHKTDEEERLRKDAKEAEEKTYSEYERARQEGQERLRHQLDEYNSRNESVEPNAEPESINRIPTENQGRDDMPRTNDPNNLYAPGRGGIEDLTEDRGIIQKQMGELLAEALKLQGAEYSDPALKQEAFAKVQKLLDEREALNKIFEENGLRINALKKSEEINRKNNFEGDRINDPRQNRDMDSKNYEEQDRLQKQEQRRMEQIKYDEIMAQNLARGQSPLAGVPNLSSPEQQKEAQRERDLNDIREQGEQAFRKMEEDRYAAEQERDRLANQYMAQQREQGQPQQQNPPTPMGVPLQQGMGRGRPRSRSLGNESDFHQGNNLGAQFGNIPPFQHRTNPSPPPSIYSDSEDDASEQDRAANRRASEIRAAREQAQERMANMGRPQQPDPYGVEPEYNDDGSVMGGYNREDLARRHLERERQRNQPQNPPRGMGGARAKDLYASNNNSRYGSEAGADLRDGPERGSFRRPFTGIPENLPAPVLYPTGHPTRTTAYGTAQRGDPVGTSETTGIRPPGVEAVSQRVLGNLETNAEVPFLPFPAEKLIAPRQPEHEYARKMANLVHVNLPYIERAQDYNQMSSGSIPDNIDRYIQPIDRHVMEPLLRSEQENYENNILPTLNGKYLKLGQHGGSRWKSERGRVEDAHYRRMQELKANLFKEARREARDDYSMDAARWIENAKMEDKLGNSKLMSKVIDTGALNEAGNQVQEHEQLYNNHNFNQWGQSRDHLVNQTGPLAAFLQGNQFPTTTYRNPANRNVSKKGPGWRDTFAAPIGNFAGEAMRSLASSAWGSGNQQKR